MNVPHKTLIEPRSLVGLLSALGLVFTPDHGHHGLRRRTATALNIEIEAAAEAKRQRRCQRNLREMERRANP